MTTTIQVLTAEEAAVILKVSKRRVWQLKKAGQLASLNEADVRQLADDRANGKVRCWRKRYGRPASRQPKQTQPKAQPTAWQRTPLPQPAYARPVPMVPMPQGLDAAAQQLLRAVWDFKRQRHHP